MNNLQTRLEALSEEKRALLLRAIQQPGRSSNTFPLSFAQERLWLLDQMESDPSIYNVFGGLRLKGVLKSELLLDAINEVIQRHASLRTIFPVLDDQPMQIVLPKLEIEMTRADLSRSPAGRREDELNRFADLAADQRLDLSKGPLIFSKLVKLTDTEHVLLVGIHHIVVDIWSIGIFTEELLAIYESLSTQQPTPLTQPPLQYSDFSKWQRQQVAGPKLKEQARFWKKNLEALPSLLPFPTDRPRGDAQSMRGGTVEVDLSPELLLGLQKLASDTGSTMFMLLMASFQVLLWKHSGLKDIVVASPIANRDRRELRGVIGYFLNTLLFRSNLSPQGSFMNLLESVKQTSLDAYENQDLPFEVLVETVGKEREMSKRPLFQAMLILQQRSTETTSAAGLTIEPIQLPMKWSHSEIAFWIFQSNQDFKGMLSYDLDLFDHQTMERVARRLTQLLHQIVQDPTRALEDLSIVSPAELEQVVTTWNDTTVDYGPQESLHRMIESAVDRFPQAPAVIFEQEVLTYRELDQRANQLARYLQPRLPKSPCRVGVLLERSVDLMVALLAILKTGSSYVPLDPSYRRIGWDS